MVILKEKIASKMDFDFGRSVEIYTDITEPKYILPRWIDETRVNLTPIKDNIMTEMQETWDYYSMKAKAIGEENYYRYDTILYYDDNDNIRLKFIENTDEEPNSFVYIAKADARNIDGLIYADENLIMSISDEMAKYFVETFNNISLGKIYVIRFIKTFMDDSRHWYDSQVIYGDITKEDIDAAFTLFPSVKSDFYDLGLRLVKD